MHSLNTHALEQFARLGSKTHQVSISCSLLGTIHASIMTSSPPSSQAHSDLRSAPTPTLTHTHPHTRTLTHTHPRALMGLSSLSPIFCQRFVQRLPPNAGLGDDRFLSITVASG
jgi:hypothetical protein